MHKRNSVSNTHATFKQTSRTDFESACVEIEKDDHWAVS